MDDENRGLGNFSAHSFEAADGLEQILKVPPGMLRPHRNGVITDDLVIASISQKRKNIENG